MTRTDSLGAGLTQQIAVSHKPGDIGDQYNSFLDCEEITAENARWYKPRPETYRTAVGLLGLRPDEVMMVAAHNYDLAAARGCGLRTAFVPRPTEYGPEQTSDLAPTADWDVVAADFLDLARRLGT